LSDKHGFTVAEMMVALLLFTAVAVPMTGMLHHLISGTGIKNKVVCLKLAQNELEKALAFPWTVAENGNVKTEVNGFTVERIVSGDDLKKVTVKVFKKDNKLSELVTLVLTKAK